MDINVKNVRPLFAHDVAVSISFKARKTEAGEVKKEASIELLFIDLAGKQAVSRIVLPILTLKDLPRILNDALKKVDKELKSKEMPKSPKIETKSTKVNYLG